MNIVEILRQLKAERERLTKAIEALEGIEFGNESVAGKHSIRTSPKPTAAKGQGNGLTPAGRKRLSELMKKRWADKRKKAAPAKAKK